jgi:hypothetical protein
VAGGCCPLIYHQAGRGVPADDCPQSGQVATVHGGQADVNLSRSGGGRCQVPHQGLNS